MTDVIELVDPGGLSDFGRVSSNLRALIVSMEGTIPGSRGFGLSGTAVDLIPEDARNSFLRELDEKVEEYIPEIRIADVEFGWDGNGRVTLRVYVEGSGEGDD